MKMKNPKLEIIRFGTEDVIATSSPVSLHTMRDGSPALGVSESIMDATCSRDELTPYHYYVADAETVYEYMYRTTGGTHRYEYRGTYALDGNNITKGSSMYEISGEVTVGQWYSCSDYAHNPYIYTACSN